MNAHEMKLYTDYQHQQQPEFLPHSFEQKFGYIQQHKLAFYALPQRKFSFHEVIQHRFSCG